MFKENRIISINLADTNPSLSPGERESGVLSNKDTTGRYNDSNIEQSSRMEQHPFKEIVTSVRQGIANIANLPFLGAGAVINLADWVSGMALRVPVRAVLAGVDQAQVLAVKKPGQIIRSIKEKINRVIVGTGPTAAPMPEAA